MNPKVSFYFMPWVYCQIPQKESPILHSTSHHSHQPNSPLASAEPHFIDTAGVKITSDEIQ